MRETASCGGAGQRTDVRSILAFLSATTILSALLVVNVFQISSLIVRPFSRRLFRDFNRECAHLWWRMVVFWAETLHQTRVVITGDSLPHGENALIIANHQDMPDAVVLMCLASRHGGLAHLKWFAKDVIKYVPGVGWGLLFLDCLFVKRNWDRDQGMITATFQTYLREQIPLWLVTFPEGTRITPKKLELAQTFAATNGHPRPERVLIPRTRGFTASVLGLGHHLQAVYDVTIAYPGPAPSMWGLFKQWKSSFHIHVRRYPLGVLPRDREGLSAWIVDRFQEKDQRLQSFDQTHSL